jgi:PIN domain nuclease of toxin-antitoxin system
MDLILDTHALVWVLKAHERIGTKQTARIEDPANRIFVSPVSVYEIANKHRIGRMPDAEAILKLAEENFAAFDWLHLPISVQHARLAGSISNSHRDPFDRLLAAQSIIENVPVMTVDTAIGELGAKIVW